jgi:hypothetical protein
LRLLPVPMPVSPSDLWRHGQLTPRLPIVPTPHEASLSAPSLKPGVGYLEQLFRRFLDRLTGMERLDLFTWVRCRLHGRISLGTVYSGTDCLVLIWQGFARALQSHGVVLVVEHRFSAEKDKQKQMFLKKARHLVSVNPQARLTHQFFGFTRSRHAPAVLSA